VGGKGLRNPRILHENNRRPGVSRQGTTGAGLWAGTRCRQGRAPDGSPRSPPRILAMRLVCLHGFLIHNSRLQGPKVAWTFGGPRWGPGGLDCLARQGRPAQRSGPDGPAGCGWDGPGICAHCALRWAANCVGLKPRGRGRDHGLRGQRVGFLQRRGVVFHRVSSSGVRAWEQAGSGSRATANHGGCDPCTQLRRAMHGQSRSLAGRRRRRKHSRSHAP
jgi:hypothetical protein